MAGHARIEKISLALTAGLLAVACTTHSEPEVPASVALTPGSIDTLIGAGDTVRLSAAALTSGGKTVRGVSFTWTSNNPGVAVVDANGLVTAVSNGTATITAQSDGGLLGHATFKSATLSATLQTSLNYAVSSNIGNHPMALTWNGSFYYGIWDGTSPGQIKRFDVNGILLDSTSVNLDPRDLEYSTADGKFYVKIYGQDWYRVDVSTGAATLVFPGMFANSQSSPAMSADGLTVYEHESGTIRVLSAVTGQMLRQLTGFATGVYPSTEGLAADGSHLFTWDGSIVYMYDLQGRLITQFTVPSGNFGFSLSYAKGLLWTSTDVSSGTGTWYGYRLVRQ